MARTVTPLSDSKCEAAKPDAKDYPLFDGRGLYLLVKSNGTKVWRFKFIRPDGRAGLATFGRYPALALKAARDRRGEALELLAHGKDPIEHAKKVKLDVVNSRANTFKAVALEWHAACSRKWSIGHAATVLRRLESHLFPTLGATPIAELKARDLLVPLKAAEKRDTLETANRLRQYQDGILRYAVQHGHMESNPARDLVGATATGKTRQRPALPFDCLPELLQRINSYSGRPVTCLAMKILQLLFVRSSELRFSRWSEFDLKRGLWMIPGEREPIEGVKYAHRGAKMGTPHLVPLSRQAMVALTQLHQLTGHLELLFPGDHYHWKPMSENTVNKALSLMGYDTKTEICAHGFRAMACSALTESGLWEEGAVERQMSHQERNKVRGAYTHLAEHLQQRRLMMQWWADYLDANRQQHITPYDFAHPGAPGDNVVSIMRG
ncbi:integrase arm-type DNA-binding domain-containing protein [Pseudomonas sp. PDM31]|uniref:tyrosine-type recombinase/integrase n=1 Tax=Pseudomonas sp. PDM31 TaxID=2854778 RepID=UPI001C457278|nr:integrase arm-type DNA-binding domain-containing protein [Pseudomonas sp. PDM31]MBV7480340.1 integrase arm-type DNA-binding domain-containing protein [Pseudomonas sp. PDM31]